MVEPAPASSAPAADPRVIAVFDAMKPYLATTAVVSLLAAPTEVGVPVVRRLLGHSGISTGPHLVSLANAVAGLAVVHAFRRDPARWDRLRHRRVPRWLAVVPVHLLVSPVLAANWERGVVLRGRSPFWGVVSPIGLLHVALTMGTLRRALRARRAGTPVDAAG
ncbi:hypothetical protein [Modestobacter versicolor]|uniref:hypothetical protein n=1 Tax=Modestobacter versicolor TaxID=429133 RepID=UPI0034DEDA47